MKRKLSFTSTWDTFICEICKEHFSIKDMFYEISGSYDKDKKNVSLAKITMLCEECNNNVHKS